MRYPYDQGETLRLEIERLFRARLGDELFELLEEIIGERKDKNGKIQSNNIVGLSC